MAVPARANDQPAIGPAPAWVKPVPMPADSAKPDDAPIRILLADMQIALEKGRSTIYAETAMKILSPQGLQAGNISFPWRPDTDTITVHKLAIRRGDQVIDVLGSGQTFTVMRREQNLDSATLDGVLTANIQPEGLQVGDILDFAVTISSADPTLKDHVEQIAAAWNLLPIGRAHLHVQWPADLALNLRQTGALPPIKPRRVGGLNVVELALDDVQPVAAPRLAPARYGVGRLAEFSDFTSWAQVGALMAPLYAKAATMKPDGPLAAEIAKIRAASADPKARAQAALDLVQNRVRYVAMLIGTGNLVPADAETSWSRRFGDCKGKTALLLALLRALDIEAVPVLVSIGGADGLDARLPMVGLFNHVLVRATIGGRTYWLDGTRLGDTDLDRIRTPDFDWGLPLTSAGAALVRMVPPPLDRPDSDVALRIDARAGIGVPAPAKAEAVLRGDGALQTSMGLAGLAADARDRALRSYWRNLYDFVDIGSVGASFDPKTGEERLTMQGAAKLEWRDGQFEMTGMDLGYRADFHRDPGPDVDAPYAVAYPFYNRALEAIQLPPGFGIANGRIDSSPSDVDRTVAGIAYVRRVRLADNVFSVEKTERSIVPEFPAKDAPSAQAALRDMADTTVYLRKPAHYVPTEEELKAALSETPTTAQAYLDRGNMLMQKGQTENALKDFDAAVSMDPKNAWTVGRRGLARLWTKDWTGGEADIEAAAAIDPKNQLVLLGRGLIAERRGETTKAIAVYSDALALVPNDLYMLTRRANLYHQAGNETAALQDAAAVLAIDSHRVDIYLLRAHILYSMGKTDEALAVAAAVAAANPDNSYAFVVSADIYGAYDRNAEAVRAFDRALAIKPEADIYVNRGLRRPKADIAARRADFDAALRLDPKLQSALAAKADLLAETGDSRGAIALYTQALVASPQDVSLLAGRGIAYARSGDASRAAADFAAARGNAKTDVELNEICWNKAISGVALESALDDCDAALAKAPGSAAYLDSRGLVLLRLGRFDEAIADYDRALAKYPRQSSSLYGRAVAEARKGNKAAADADCKAAALSNPDVAADFEGYGVKL